MTVERLIRIFAGVPLFLSKHFLWLTAFVGANLLQSGFSRLCPLESLLRRLGVPSGATACA